MVWYIPKCMFSLPREKTTTKHTDSSLTADVVKSDVSAKFKKSNVGCFSEH